MSPSRVSALGPVLLPLAREHTNDLKQAQFLVHQVVQRLLNAPSGGNGQFKLHDVRDMMAVAAERDGIVGRTPL